MVKQIKVGLVIADVMEYAAWEELISSNAERKDFYNRKGHRFIKTLNGTTYIIDSILCGIGMINATAAAMHLVNNGAEILFNYGLSGGISGVKRGDDVVGTSFLEHDFDLVCCGYKKCEKPEQEYIYYSDENLTKKLLEIGDAKKSGNMASGDRFVSDNTLRDILKNEFSICCCDMETAGIAYVANLTDTPFTCLRRVSDDAGDDATEDYHDMNQKSMFSLAEDIYNLIISLGVNK